MIHRMIYRCLLFSHLISKYMYIDFFSKVIVSVSRVRLHEIKFCKTKAGITKFNSVDNRIIRKVLSNSTNDR